MLSLYFWVVFKHSTKGELLGEADKAGHSKVMRFDMKEKVVANDKIEKQNPPKYELLEDLANMTYLSEASVVYNLSERYTRFLIYTYSSRAAKVFLRPGVYTLLSNYSLGYMIEGSTRHF